MLTLARANVVRAGARNVEFLRGQIEAIPLPDSSVDVVFTNCVTNLSTDKPAVLAGMFRVLVPGGRIGAAGFVDATVESTHEAAPGMHAAIIRAVRPR